MFINSLFLSKLLNLKTDGQPANDVGDDFNYLFSEIIKVKTSQNDSVFIPENIGGTLLDHKTIFISNKSPLDKINVSKAVNNNDINQIENLYKLFLEPLKQVEAGSKKINLSLNKIISDKAQFVKSIEGLIKNIFNSNSDNQINTVEIKYVSKNLIESVKLNEKNLSQFTEFLSGLIDNNSSFSFVIGANAKQILFDVENVNLDSEDYESLNISAEEAQNQASTSSISSNSDESPKFIKKLTKESLEKNPAVNLDNSFEKNTSLEVTQTKFVQTEEKFVGQSDKISDLSVHTESKNIVDVVPGNEKTESKLAMALSNDKEMNFNNSKENNIDLKLPDKSVKPNTTKQFDKGNNSPVIIEFDEELGNELTFSNKNSVELNELKDKNLGEVKVVIKSKPNEYHYQQHIRADLKSDDKIKIETATVSRQQNESNSNRVSLTAQSEKNITSLKNISTDNFEKDLPEVASASVNEPRIGRAGLPLIADYQDWDLVFERIEKNSINHEHVQTNLSDVKNDVSRQKIDAKDRNNEVELDRSNSTKTSNKQNEPVNENLNNQKDIFKLTKKVIESNRINDVNVKSVLNEKVLNLKLPDEKKVVSISHSISDHAKNLIEVKENSDGTNKVNLKNEFTQEDKSFVTANKQNSFSDDTLENAKSDLRPEVKSESLPTKNDSNEQSAEGNLKKANEHFQRSNDKNKVDNSTVKGSEFKNEFQDLKRQEFIPTEKINLINNKSIVEHFIKNPIESRTLEKFIQILDKQEIIQRSEIVSYSKLNHTVEIKLAPQELGKIKILLDTNDNNVSAKIEVNSEQTKVIVVNNLPQLKETLTQQGINLNNVNVTVTSEEHQGSEQTKQKSKKKSQESNTKIENADEKITVRHLGYNTYEYLA